MWKKLSFFGMMIRSAWSVWKSRSKADSPKSTMTTLNVVEKAREAVAVADKLQSLDPALQSVFRQLQGRYKSDYPDREMVLTHGHREPVEQLRLFCQGRLPEKPGPIVTWKDGFVGKSEHNMEPSRAFDFGIKINGKFEWRDDIMLPHLSKYIPETLAALGWAPTVRYGGVFNDYYHIELRK